MVGRWEVLQKMGLEDLAAQGQMHLPNPDNFTLLQALASRWIVTHMHYIAAGGCVDRGRTDQYWPG
jgi:hypothetical protein